MALRLRGEDGRDDDSILTFRSSAHDCEIPVVGDDIAIINLLVNEDPACLRLVGVATRLCVLTTGFHLEG